MYDYPIHENCWMVQLKPLDLEERKDRELLKKIQNFCINDEGICVMGWPATKSAIKTGEPLSSVDGEFFLNYNKREKGKTSAFNCYKDMKANDLVMTRLSNGKYYIAALVEEAKYYYDDKEYYDHFSWGCKVDKWEPIEDVQILPAIIRGKYSSCYHNTVLRVNNKDEEYLKNAMTMIYERLKYKDSQDFRRLRMKMDVSSFAKCLDYKELEDLVYLYMLKENPDYILLPSTCKMNQLTFEFWMKKGAEHNIVCQVKNQIDPDSFPHPSTYEDYKNIDKIYLFCGKWTEKRDKLEAYKVKVKESGQKNLEVIEPKALFDVLDEKSELFDDEYRYVEKTNKG